MKANEAPEKIYIPTAGNELHYHMTCPNNDFQESVEYTRTDAFIEKACDWFRRIDYDDNIPPFETTEEFIEGFKNYMKGE